MTPRFAAALLALAPLAILIQPAPAQDSARMLPNGWSVRPHGKQTQLDTLPLRSLLSPDGKFVVVLHAGYRQPSLRVLNAETLAEVDRAMLEDAWRGMCFAPGGRLLYVGGAATAGVYEFGFSPEGRLEKKRTFSTVPRGEEKSDDDFAGDVQMSPDGRLIYVAALFRDEVRVINPQSGWVIDRFPTARRPYRVLPHPDGKSFFVTSWAEGSVHRLESSNGNQLYFKRLGLQPMDMVWRQKPVKVEEDEEPPPWGARLFVATAGTNLVHVLGLTESGDLRQIESIKVSMWPRQPLGMTPTALALNEDESRLYVVCSNANVVAVVDVSTVKSRLLGFVPAGWYPTSVTPLAEGRLLVLNGKGDGSGPNPNGPNPLGEPVVPGKGSPSPGFVGRRQTGSAWMIDAAGDARLFEFTKAALALSPYKDEHMIGVREIPPGNPIPPGPKVPPDLESPIKHVLYIVKENRTYDQVFGDIGKGGSDPALAVFGEDVTPNHHKLAREFVLFDRFHASGDAGADGLYWATAAIAPPFVEQFWPAVYAGRLNHDFAAYELASAPPAGFLWTQAALSGMPLRNYGFAVRNVEPSPGEGIEVKNAIDPALGGATVPAYRGFDLDYPDVKRAEAFLEDFRRMDEDDRVPRLMVLRLGNDHTSGTAAGKVAPKSAVADNDLALGMIVEGCSKSGAWPGMAIFVVENNASGGPGRVDGHRSIALAISPYSRRGAVDSTRYNSASVLRTIELILGLNPMTQFDAAATPMWAAFGAEPDTEPYEAVRPKAPLNETNP